METLFCGDYGCGVRMQCVQFGVWVNDGPVAVCQGDIYSCPVCHKEVIGTEKPVTVHGDAQLVQRVKDALATAGTPYVRHEYVVQNH